MIKKLAYIGATLIIAAVSFAIVTKTTGIRVATDRACPAATIDVGPVTNDPNQRRYREARRYGAGPPWL